MPQVQKPDNPSRASYPETGLRRDVNLKPKAKKRPREEEQGAGAAAAPAPAGPPPKRQQRSGEEAFPRPKGPFPAQLEPELQKDTHPPTHTPKLPRGSLTKGLPKSFFPLTLLPFHRPEMDPRT